MIDQKAVFHDGNWSEHKRQPPMIFTSKEVVDVIKFVCIPII
jgi:hypothetical protein